MLIPSNELKTFRRPLLPERPRSDFDAGEKGDAAFAFYQPIYEKTKGVMIVVPRLTLEVWDEYRTRLEALEEGEEKDRPKRAMAFLREHGPMLIHEIKGLTNEKGEALSWGKDRDLILDGFSRLGLVPDLITSLRRCQEPGLLETFRPEDLGLVGTGDRDSDPSVG